MPQTAAEKAQKSVNCSFPARKWDFPYKAGADMSAPQPEMVPGRATAAIPQPASPQQGPQVPGQCLAIVESPASLEKGLGGRQMSPGTRESSWLTSESRPVPRINAPQGALRSPWKAGVGWAVCSLEDPETQSRKEDSENHQGQMPEVQHQAPPRIRVQEKEHRLVPCSAAAEQAAATQPVQGPQHKDI